MKKHKRIFIFSFLIALVALVFYAFLSAGSPPVARLSSPPDNAKGVSVSNEIVIEFKKTVSQKQLSSLSFEIEPTVDTEAFSKENQVVLKPKNDLLPNTKYVVSTLYRKQNIFSFSFTTALSTEAPVLEKGDLPTNEDYQFAQAYQKLLQNYPWYQKLPLETGAYRIVYDFEKSSFRIRLKLSPEDEKTKEGMVKKALDSLKRIGVPEPIKYYVVLGE